MTQGRHSSASDPGSWQPAPPPRPEEVLRYPPAAAAYPQQRADYGAGREPAAYQRPGHAQPARGGVRLSAAASFWYILGCIAFGAMYFVKVPAKKALSEAGLAQMTSAEQFWYVLQCIAFGAGYFAKIPIKKALSEAAWLSR
jgi:hypothetical protein